MTSEIIMKFDIEFNNKHQVYTPGTTVEGNVVLEVFKEEKIDSITIVLSGEARTYWTVIVGNRIYLFSDSEGLVNTMNLLSSGFDDQCGQVITAGVHKFPFQFQLPADGCPSSFQSETPGEGSIRYWLRATASQQSVITGFAERDITVNEVVDTNIPQLIEPLTNSNEKTVCCLWCASGPISLSVTTDRGGYSIGESIAISINAKNCSKRRVAVVRASLKQKATLRAKDRTFGHGERGELVERVEEKLIQRIERPGIEPGGTSTWVNELLLIPVTTTPTINSCRIIRLSYSLTVTLALPYAADLHVTIPITIGNVPYDQKSQTAGKYP